MEIDHIHFFVHDAAFCRQCLVQQMDWTCVDQMILPDRHLEILLYQNSYFLFSSPRLSAGAVANYLENHAPGVVDIAFRLDHLSEWRNHLASAMRIGRKLGKSPSLVTASEDPISTLILARLASLKIQPQDLEWVRISGWGDICHTLLQRPKSQVDTSNLQSRAIDHVVLNVARGELNAAAAYYQDLLGFKLEQTFKISTGNSGLHSQVLRDENSEIYFNINEPSSANSQIQWFLDSNRGAGIQHIALHGNPIISTVAKLRDRGLGFLPVPHSYFDHVLNRLEDIRQQVVDWEEWPGIVDQQILIDWQSDKPKSLLLQIFTLPILPGSSFFFEFIERRGHVEGFGEGNFLALFKAIEDDINNQLP